WIRTEFHSQLNHQADSNEIPLIPDGFIEGGCMQFSTPSSPPSPHFRKHHGCFNLG
ncbi:hypothetical protein CCACVL1_07752, partial [Corchorus capsularis]